MILSDEDKELIRNHTHHIEVASNATVYGRKALVQVIPPAGVSTWMVNRTVYQQDENNRFNSILSDKSYPFPSLDAAIDWMNSINLNIPMEIVIP